MAESEMTPAASPAHNSAGGSECSCPSCSGKRNQDSPQFIYSIGKIEVRFPSLGIEREFQQRERRLTESRPTHGERMYQVLKANSHLARAVCYVHSIGSIPAYIVVPTGTEVLNGLLEAVRGTGQPERWDIVIGKRGPMATPTTCSGLLVPMIACDQVYTFGMAEFLTDLVERVRLALSAKKQEQRAFEEAAADLFRRIAGSLENLGAQEGSRALNYLLVQHPGLFVAAAERAGRAILDTIETRAAQGGTGNRVVSVILTFLDRATGVPERLFCRVDVTEEWPFVADVLHGGQPPLGLYPYIENSALGSQPY